MSRKRRQRSTSIHKRIVKRQRERQKAARREARLAGRDKESAFLLRMELPRADAEAVGPSIVDLEKRLEAAGQIRGWTVAGDLEGDFGLNWLRGLLDESLGAQDDDPLTIDFPEDAKKSLLDRLAALEMAATGLELNYDAGFPGVAKALSHAEELGEDDEEEEE